MTGTWSRCGRNIDPLASGYLWTVGRREPNAPRIDHDPGFVPVAFSDHEPQLALIVRGLLLEQFSPGGQVGDLNHVALRGLLEALFSE